MKKLKFLVSLTTNDNDYQIEQAAAAEEAARRLSADVQIIYAENDSITQSQQILNVIQSRAGPRCLKWPGPPWPPASAGWC